MITLRRRRSGEKDGELLEFPTFTEAKRAAFGYKHVSLRCDSCEAAVINGTFCHEHGCPEAWRDEHRECQFCGCIFQPETKYQKCCDDACSASYIGAP